MYQNDWISPEKLIETITTSIFFLKRKENIENDMAAYNFLAIFLEISVSQRFSSFNFKTMQNNFLWSDLSRFVDKT
jgi:hypothetical protein